MLLNNEMIKSFEKLEKNHSKVDCNVVYRDSTKIESLNKQFMESEIRKNGVEPSFF